MTFLLGVALGSLVTIGFAFIVTAGEDDLDNFNN